MIPKSVPLRVANLCLLGVGLFILGLSRNWIVRGIGAGLAWYPIMRAFRLARERRLELYQEEINRRMQSADQTPTDPKP